MAWTIQLLTAWINERTRGYVVVCPVYNIMLAQEDAQYRSVLREASLVTPDGMPLVWLCHWGGYADVDRVYGPDLMLLMSQVSAEHGYRNFYYGGDEGVAEELARVMQARFPGLQVVGTYTPPFRTLSAAEETVIIDRINQANADVIWVGLGSPKQDSWMARNRDKLWAPVLIGVGAAFNIHTGRVRQAPRWLQNMGLEWLFRLCTEPRRLWRRYLIYNPLFIIQIMGQMLRSGVRNR